MGDKSPKSKARDKKQKTAIKQDNAAKAQAKQTRQSSVATQGKK